MDKRDWKPRIGGTPGKADNTKNYFPPGTVAFPVGSVDNAGAWVSGWNQLIDNINNKGSLKEIEDIFPRPFDAYPLIEKPTVMGQQILEVRTILDTWWGIWKWTNEEPKTFDAIDIEELRYRATCGQGFHLSGTGSNQEFLPVVGEYDIYNGLGDLLGNNPASNNDLSQIFASFERLLALMPEEAGRFWVLWPIKIEDDGSNIIYTIPGWQVMWGPITLSGKCKNVNGYPGTLSPPKGQLGNGPLGNKQVLYTAELMILSQKNKAPDGTASDEYLEKPTVQMVYGNSPAGMAGYGYGVPFKVTKYGQYNGGNPGESSVWAKVTVNAAYWKAHSNSAGGFSLVETDVKMTGAKHWRDYVELDG